jgi:hypothetical protein
MVTGLAQDGSYRLNTPSGIMDIRPGANILRMDSRGLMAKVDYIALASIRSSSAYLGYNYFKKIRDLQGATTPSNLAKWFRDAGYEQVTEKTRRGSWTRGTWWRCSSTPALRCASRQGGLTAWMT